MTRFPPVGPTLCVLMSLLLPTLAFAGGQLYLLSPTPPFWPDASFPVPFNINPDSAMESITGPLPSQQFVEATEAAFSTWQDIPTSRITFARGPDVDAPLDSDPNDDVNLIVFHDWAVVQGLPIPLPPGVLGVTNSVFDFETGEMQGAAITLNPDPLPDLPNPDWSTSGAPWTLDVEAVILHEAGHFQGLCHSNVRNDSLGNLEGPPSNAAVMFPFIGGDVLDSRTPDPDDIAWHGYIYPSPSYDASFGSIEGNVPYSSMMLGCMTPAGANGAHVVARDLNQTIGGEPRMVGGTYSYRADGRLAPYRLPGLPPGEYGVWIEPMDGSPVAALQINTRMQFSLDTDFPEDWYSGSSESGTEAAPHDPASAVSVTVAGGERLTGIDILIEEFVPGWCMNVVSEHKRGQSGRTILGALGILFLPFLFLYLIKRARPPSLRTESVIPSCSCLPSTTLSSENRSSPAWNTAGIPCSGPGRASTRIVPCASSTPGKHPGKPTSGT